LAKVGLERVDRFKLIGVPDKKQAKANTEELDLTTTFLFNRSVSIPDFSGSPLQPFGPNLRYAALHLSSTLE